MSSLVHDYYTAFNSGDRGALLAMLTEDVVHEIAVGSHATGIRLFQEVFDAAEIALAEALDCLFREYV